MQMNRLKAIQEEAIYMQEQQHKELEFLKAELQVMIICVVNTKSAFQDVLMSGRSVRVLIGSCLSRRGLPVTSLN